MRLLVQPVSMQATAASNASSSSFGVPAMICDLAWWTEATVMLRYGIPELHGSTIS